jgi:hypothetical protein
VERSRPDEDPRKGLSRRKAASGSGGNANRTAGPAHRRGKTAAAVMRKAPAPGAKVAAVLGHARQTAKAHCPTHPARPRTEGVAERMLVNTRQAHEACAGNKSRRFFSVLIAARHLHAGPPQVPTGAPRESGGGLGGMGGAVKSASAAADGGHGRTSRVRNRRNGTKSGPVVRRPVTVSASGASVDRRQRRQTPTATGLQESAPDPTAPGGR